MTTRFSKFAATAIATAALGFGALAVAGTASADPTFGGGVVNGPNGGQGTVHWNGPHGGTANVHWR